MFARVTMLEIDTVRINLDTALKRFEESALPELRKQPGYKGLYVLTTSEGKGLLMSLWETEEAAEAGVASGYYDEQVAKFITLLRQSPGRDHYKVMFAEAPDTSSS